MSCSNYCKPEFYTRENYLNSQYSVENWDHPDCYTSENYLNSQYSVEDSIEDYRHSFHHFHLPHIHLPHLPHINIKAIGEKILRGIENGIQKAFKGRGGIIGEITALRPVDGVIQIPKALADKLLKFIIEKLLALVLDPIIARMVKPIFEKKIWPHLEKPAINLLNKFLPKIKIAGYSLSIETFVYERYNHNGIVEYDTDMYEGYESPWSENYLNCQNSIEDWGHHWRSWSPPRWSPPRFRLPALPIFPAVNINEICEKILGGMERGVEDVLLGGDEIVEEIKALEPKDGVLEIPKPLANKLLKIIIARLMSLLLNPLVARMVKPIFEKEIWPHVEEPAMKLLNKFLPKIKIAGFSLLIETFVYESYNYNGIVEYDNDMYEGYESRYNNDTITYENPCTIMRNGEFERYNHHDMYGGYESPSSWRERGYHNDESPWRRGYY